MRSIIDLALLGLVSLLWQAPATAQETAPCPAQPTALPPELAGWAKRAPLAAATDAARIKAATLLDGVAVDAALTRTSELHYAARPEKPGGTVSYGGMFGFTVKQAGTYRVALGSGAWIDLLNGKMAAASSAHGHGPSCSGIRKMVDFPLKPGRYILQIAANGSPALPLMIVRLP